MECRVACHRLKLCLFCSYQARIASTSRAPRYGRKRRLAVGGAYLPCAAVHLSSLAPVPGARSSLPRATASCIALSSSSSVESYPCARKTSSATLEAKAVHEACVGEAAGEASRMTVSIASG